MFVSLVGATAKMLLPACLDPVSTPSGQMLAPLTLPYPLVGEGME